MGQSGPVNGYLGRKLIGLKIDRWAFDRCDWTSIGAHCSTAFAADALPTDLSDKTDRTVTDPGALVKAESSQSHNALKRIFITSTNIYLQQPFPLAGLLNL